MKNLVSIVVPIYGVEKYLKKCVDSLLNQTHQDLDIILVDDGSPDLCPEICDEYAKLDKRIRVIHKKNGGLSSARNAGINAALGDYICFIDSDDYVSENFVETLYFELIKHNCDYVACNFDYIYNEEGKGVLLYNFKNKNFENEEIIDNLFGKYNLMLTIACNKLYKKSLFNKVKYTEGIIHEDEDIAYRIAEKCKRVRIINNVLYHYFQRMGSITNNRNVEKKEIMIEIARKRYQYIKENYSSKRIISKASYLYLIFYVVLAKKYLNIGNKKRGKSLLYECKSQKEVFYDMQIKEKIKFIAKKALVLFFNR